MSNRIRFFFRSNIFLTSIAVFAFLAMLINQMVPPEEINAEKSWESRNQLIQNRIKYILKDSLAYKEGLKKQDSINDIFRFQDEVNYLHFGEEGFIFPVWGLNTVTECNYCTNLNSKSH